MDEAIYGLDVRDLYSNDESELHAKAKVHVADVLREVGYMTFIEYPLPRCFSKDPKGFSWHKQTFKGGLGDNEYFTYNGFASGVPIQEAAEREFGQLSFIFDVAVEGPRGLAGAIEICAYNPITAGKRKYASCFHFPLHEVDATWALNNWHKASTPLLCRDGSTVTYHKLFPL